MIIKIRREDLMADMPIAPGWYKGKVVKVGAPEIQGDRIDISITLDFEDPALKADSRTVDYTFYNAAGKGIGFTKSYMAAIKGMSVQELIEKMDAGGAKDMDFDMDKTLNAKIQFKLIHNTFQGRVSNRVEAFLPYDAEVAL